MPPKADKALLSANLRANLAALKNPDSPDGEGVAAWLESAQSSERIEVLEAKDGSLVLSIGGAIQDSLVAPAKEAGKIFERGLVAGRGEIWLFGLGGPALLKAALSKAGKLTVFEPDPQVARAALSAIDASFELSSGKLSIVSPERLSSGIPRPISASILAHPSSVRRAPPFFAGFERFLTGSRALAAGPDGISIMIVGPLSGGSEPMGGFLYRAAEELGLKRLLLKWPEKFVKAAESLKSSPDPRRASEIFEASAALAAEEAVKFKPSLFLALAQAPLDAEGIKGIRRASPESALAFWFVEDFRRFGYIESVAAAWDLLLHIQEGPFEKILKSWGVEKAMYLPPAADPAVFFPGPPDPKFSSKASFMGAGYPNRLKIMNDLAKFWKASGKALEDLKIFGSGWERASAHLAPHVFEGGRRVSTEECASIFRSAEVSLNIHSGPGDGFDAEGLFVNPRTFEVAASGGCQIVDFRPLLEDLFPSGELTAIRDPAELPDALDRALADPDLRRAQAEDARKTVMSRHLYRHRLEAILKAMGAPGSPPEPLER